MQSSSKNSEIHNSNQKLVLHMWEDSGQSFLNQSVSILSLEIVFTLKFASKKNKTNSNCEMSIVKVSKFTQGKFWTFSVFYEKCSKPGSKM